MATPIQNKTWILHDVDERIAQLVAQVRAAQEEIGGLNAQIEQAKNALGPLLHTRGENWSDDAGYARLVAESVRTSYDTKALDDLIIKDPLHYGWLKDYRNESNVRGAVQVK